jgi:hypothetical protein
MEPLPDAGFRSIARSPPVGRATAAVEFMGNTRQGQPLQTTKTSSPRAALLTGTVFASLPEVIGDEGIARDAEASSRAIQF